MQSRWWVLTAIGVGTFMSALDGSVVNTILPVLRYDLHTSVAGIEWVATIYLLVVSALLLGVGRAGDLRGHKRLYLAGFVLFVAASVVCGLAVSATMLIATRAVQAVGAAMLFANAPAILTKTFPPQQRGRALGAQATFTYLGLTAGPSLGGWLAHALGWRWAFYINVPVGVVGILLGLRFIADDRPDKAAEPFDLRGAALFTAGLVALLIALNQGHAWGWSSPLDLGLFAAAAVLLAAFIAVERRHAHPMLDLTLFRNRTFGGTTVAALCNYMCVYSVVFVLPFLLIQGRGLDTQRAGLVLTAQPIVMALVAPMSGALSDRIGSRLLAAAGMLILAGGLVLLALSTSASLAVIAGGLAVVGLGVGLFTSPNNSALMGAAPRERQGIAAGVLATARNVGMVLGVGISGAVFTTYLARGGAAPLARGVAASLFVSAAIAGAGMLVALLAD
ncbi:MAG TPA: MFS transporter [Thermoanaerobaculia bacterium]|jgi:EmrB/QacA subfamily drug resistance transporter